jgi:hypothetical protein
MNSWAASKCGINGQEGDIQLSRKRCVSVTVNPTVGEWTVGEWHGTMSPFNTSLTQKYTLITPAHSHNLLLIRGNLIESTASGHNHVANKVLFTFSWATSTHTQPCCRSCQASLVRQEYANWVHIHIKTCTIYDPHWSQPVIQPFLEARKLWIRTRWWSARQLF